MGHIHYIGTAVRKTTVNTLYVHMHSALGVGALALHKFCKLQILEKDCYNIQT